MTMHEFGLLTDERQKEVLYDKGMLLSCRKNGALIYNIWQIDGLFIEFCLNLSNYTMVRTGMFEDYGHTAANLN